MGGGSSSSCGTRTSDIIYYCGKNSDEQTTVVYLCVKWNRKKWAQLIVCVWELKHLLGTRHTQQFSHEKAQTHTRFVRNDLANLSMRYTTELAHVLQSEAHTTWKKLAQFKIKKRRFVWTKSLPQHVRNSVRNDIKRRKETILYRASSHTCGHIPDISNANM